MTHSDLNGNPYCQRVVFLPIELWVNNFPKEKAPSPYGGGASSFYLLKRQHSTNLPPLGGIFGSKNIVVS